MTRNVKIARPIIRPAAYGQAFAQLDTALAENTPSNDGEKIDLLRIALFGDAARDLIRGEASERQSSQNGEIYPGKSG
jgi:hypothetical protein